MSGVVAVKNCLEWQGSRHVPSDAAWRRFAVGFIVFRPGHLRGCLSAEMHDPRRRNYRSRMTRTLVWRWLDLPSLSRTAITVAAVMAVPEDAATNQQKATERAIHR